MDYKIDKDSRNSDFAWIGILKIQKGQYQKNSKGQIQSRNWEI